MNYFAYRSAAGRYTHSRPFFHPLVIRMIKRRLDLREPFADALDVGCGTGQSSVALKEIAGRVVGTDISREMLSVAPRDAGIRYVEAYAEHLPFRDAGFDLLTASLAFHWFDRARFLAEAYRLLRPRGWLVVYNNWFVGEMRDNADYAVWHRGVYLRRLPSPPRHSQPLDEETASQHGFRFLEAESYANEVVFSPEELANYLTLESVYSWLTDSFRPLFKEAKAAFAFAGVIWYLQKKASSKEGDGQA
jgi:SAM-dependent methyltransferase